VRDDVLGDPLRTVVSDEVGRTEVESRPHPGIDRVLVDRVDVGVVPGLGCGSRLMNMSIRSVCNTLATAREVAPTKAFSPLV